MAEYTLKPQENPLFVDGRDDTVYTTINYFLAYVSTSHLSS
jgi:hypothetical protein